MTDDAVESFLSPLLALAEELWGEAPSVSEACTLLGPVRYAGCPRPLPSDAVRLAIGGDSVWIPCPFSASEGKAAIFLHAGRKLVLPVIRLFVHPSRRPESATVEYVEPGAWIADALRRWRFPLLTGKQGGDDSSEGCARSATIAESLKATNIDLSTGLQVLANVVRYAIFGTDSSGRYTIAGATGLLLPDRPQWVRPVPGTPLGEASARTFVITAALITSDGDAQSGGPGLIPKAGVSAAAYRIDVRRGSDRGMDPVHTAEGTDIRLTGRIGRGTEICDRRLVAGDDDVPLSISTAQIPFSGHDDPRRLLMAANMQVHAVRVSDAETPLVRTALDSDDCRPYGVNVRVGYLAWKGLNHEDAWVISEMAARRLAATREETMTLPIGSLELDAEVLVRPGILVRRGQPLIRRSASPALLASPIDVLARLPRYDTRAVFECDPEAIATCAGTVVAIEIWDLLRGSVRILKGADDRQGPYPDGYHVPRDVVCRYRQLIRVTIASELPLSVGDKLASRHGHKGVVGAILREADMPRWRGRPLEALIDPVSVFNRSNWGQVYETLAGSATSGAPGVVVASRATSEVLERARSVIGCDEAGRSCIDPPESGDWLTESTRALAGVQFVMRLPQHARERLSSSPSPVPGVVKDRPQRFGEMDHWALWAHGVRPEPAGDTPGKGRGFHPGVERLRRMLGMAGYELSLDVDAIVVRTLELDKAPRGKARVIPLGEKPSGSGKKRKEKMTRPEIYEQIDAVGPEDLSVLEFDEPVASVRLPRANARDREDVDRTRDIRWLPVIPLRPDRALPPDHADDLHPLTQALRAVAGAAYRLGRDQGAQESESTLKKLEVRLRREVSHLMWSAYACAVGVCSTGGYGSKWSLLRRRVLGRNLRSSARAVVAPAGMLNLTLDEIGLPPALARALLGVSEVIDEEGLAHLLRDRWFWIKRDPVLHRWGLLAVRARLIEDGDVIRLPASMLAPMQFDFDGDQGAIFAELPGQPDDPGRCRPSTIAWDPKLKRPMFVPGKQYVHGIGLVMKDSSLMAQFRSALLHAGAPDWDDSLGPRAAIEDWVKKASGQQADGRWWGILERFALDGVALDPGMGLGLMSAEALGGLRAVEWGAAKRDVFEEGEAREALRRILEGKSLAPYSPGGCHLADPIAEVMVAAKVAIGRFGGALRRIIHSIPVLDHEAIADAQALTELVTQRALSVKAGKRPIRVADYERLLKTLKEGGEPSSENPELAAILEPAEVKELWKRLQTALAASEKARWLVLFREHHRLAELVQSEPSGEIRIPLDDPRARAWLRSDV